jgi:thiamine biosynthesis lipoprotein
MQLVHRRRFLRLALGAGAPLSCGGLWLTHVLRQVDGPCQRIERSSRALGTRVSMIALHADRAVAAAAIEAAFAELEEVEEVMSLYRPHSQLCRLNREQVLNDPPPYLVQVLEEAQRLAALSEGAFDVTVQPLWELYAAAHRVGCLPAGADLAEARAKVAWRRLQVSPRCIRLEPGMAVTLNGIAQGFAVDCAIAALRRHGIQHALVDTGELGALGQKSSLDPWTIGIQHPRVEDAYISVAELDGRCLATSGDYATSFTADRRDNHIFDPRTGRSPVALASVSVLAETGLLADGLSTTLFVLGLERGLELVESIPTADALFMLKDGRTLATHGFPEQV